MKGNYAGKSHAHQDMKKEARKRGPCANYTDCQTCMDKGFIWIREGAYVHSRICPDCHPDAWDSE